MPFRCAGCDTVVQSMDQANCKCTNPYFAECVTIHYTHAEGPGEVVSKSYNNQGASVDDAGISKPATIRNLVPRKLACNVPVKSKPVFSIMRSIVTCSQCLAFIEKLNNRSTECQSSEARTTEPITHST